MNAYLVHVIVRDRNRRMTIDPADNNCVVDRFLDYAGDNMRKIAVYIAKSWWGQI